MVLITRIGSALDHFGRTNLDPPIWSRQSGRANLPLQPVFGRWQLNRSGKLV